MTQDLRFALKSIRFDEHYSPADSTRITTNFANLARGESRQQNLRNALRMMDARFNSLAHWDNPTADRYGLELDIVSVDMCLVDGGKEARFPLIEVLQTTIVDKKTQQRTAGMVGNNFSSFVRDYDFSVVLPEYNRDRAEFAVPADFGDLHGKLFKEFVNSSTYTSHFAKLPVICISVAASKTYRRTGNQHPVLGIEYEQSAPSLTDQYFAKMGMQVRFFMPPNSLAPFAFYFYGDLLADYSSLELISSISTMESFQKIYRPEIYNANSVAGPIYQPSLQHEDYSLTKVDYDREERSQLAVKQGKFAEVNFMQPYAQELAQWAARCAY